MADALKVFLSLTIWRRRRVGKSMRLSPLDCSVLYFSEPQYVELMVCGVSYFIKNRSWARCSTLLPFILLQNLQWPCSKQGLDRGFYRGPYRFLFMSVKSRVRPTLLRKLHSCFKNTCPCSIMTVGTKSGAGRKIQRGMTKNLSSKFKSPTRSRRLPFQHLLHNPAKTFQSCI